MSQLILQSIMYKMNCDQILDLVSSNVSGTTHQRISRKNLEKLELTVPLLKEQKAIADTLSTFDEHIENLEKLIEKKKMIRDGAVEDLMSGKTRLDGFDGDWIELSFKDYFTKLRNNTLSRDKLSSSGKVSNIHYGDVLIKYGPVLDSVEDVPKVKGNIKIDSLSVLKINDVIIADTAEDNTVGKAVQIGDIHKQIVSGLHTIPCRPNYPTAPRFLGYYINSDVFHDQLLPYITGIKVSSISRKSIDKTKLYIPSDIKEQRAIASVLSSMDDEIDNLQNEKEKLEKIKQGAMDDLLTGRVRLV
ncbi:restriction endonuclease subunit S [Hutsoniella sourekii]|uniref:restriction endonuclease subunit S n=1 Tax=Hutsoniella sourekii TaxID=87650 RepID=UPI00146FB065|nr:restriction endonuclease subunit S [Hutsoniella sourekii]